MAPVSLILSSVGRISWPAAGPAAKASSATQIASADLIDTSNAIQMRVTHPPLSFLASWSGASPARRRAGDVTLREEVSGSLRRRDRHVDDTGAGIACRVPGCAALVIRHATYRNRGHVARRRNGRRCGGGRRSRRGLGDDRGRRDRLACGGAHYTDNGCPGHEAGGRVAVVPVRAVAAVAAVDVVVHGRHAGVLHLRRCGLPGGLVLARCRLALVLILAHAVLPLALRLLPTLLRIRPRIAGLTLPASGLHGSPATTLASALRGTATGESPARGSASTGESAAPAAALRAAAATSPPASLRIRRAHEAQHEHGRHERRPDATA